MSDKSHALGVVNRSRSHRLDGMESDALCGRGYEVHMNLRNGLVFVFVAAIVMGSGPGLRLINPDPADPNAVFTVLGLPKIYAWGLLWYGVQLVVILTAYFRIWEKKSGDLEKVDGGRFDG